jgi:uncharacterized protein DUF4238
MSDDLARANHSVPEAYLKGWAPEPGRVWSYRLLVPRQNYPEWQLRATASLARYTDLYTSSYSGADSDSFERWLNEAIEQPALAALAKVRADEPLREEDWRRLSMYAAALDLRTPASYMEQAERWSREIPETLSRTMSNLEHKLRRAARTGELSTAAPGGEALAFPIRVTRGPTQDGKVPIRAEVVMGREMWLWNQRRQLTSTADVLAKHRWSILHPHPGSEWFTSDHPVVRLNYYGEDHYDFRGGWGNPGTELILALSPRHLMYTKIGSAGLEGPTLSPEHTLLIQRFIAERAHRWIFARGQPRRAVWFRPRTVDQTAFQTERAVWDSWHERHREVESGPAKDISSGECA